MVVLRRTHICLKLICLFLINILFIYRIFAILPKKFSLLSSVSQAIIVIRTSHHCQSRLNYLVQSWIPTDINKQSNIYLLTDDISKYSNESKLKSFRNVIETNCPQSHQQFDLCCKTSHEFELYYNLTKVNSNIYWMCRFDDDQYVNLNNLNKILSKLDSSDSYYIGRTSIKHRLKVWKTNRTYRFATYGAGVCFSSGLLNKLRPYVRKSVLPFGCIRQKLPDDVYMGYVIETILNVSLLSLTNLFHSHLENLDHSFRHFDIEHLERAITFGFSWDRYKLQWLPIIHQLISLTNLGHKSAAEYFWKFLQNYEKSHPENLTNQYDESCTSYKRQRHQSKKLN